VSRLPCGQSGFAPRRKPLPPPADRYLLDPQFFLLANGRDQNEISKRGLEVARGKLETRLDRELKRSYRSPQNQRLANHLRRERDAMFTFLYCSGLEATNYRAEQALRPMVVTRKVWGGNRTERGANTQSILVSILHTCRQQLRPG
jgi:transposase